MLLAMTLLLTVSKSYEYTTRAQFLSVSYRFRLRATHNLSRQPRVDESLSSSLNSGPQVYSTLRFSSTASKGETSCTQSLAQLHGRMSFLF
jgi:hypothetical protein